jgi:hypothetical protein
MSERYSTTCGDHGGTNSNGKPCGHPEGYGTDFDEGKCKHHRGTNADGSSHEGNDWAAKHGAYSESFVSDFLTESEQERVEQAAEVLSVPEGAQADARMTAAICKEQFRRTGDERFLRRYESICDKANIFPDEEIDLSGEVTVREELGDDKKAMLADLFDRDVQPE